jgi:hypothetical protein
MAPKATAGKAIQQAPPVSSRSQRVPSPSGPKFPEASAFSPFSPVLGNQAMLGLLKSGRIQPKLRVSQPGDADELEADRVANQVTSTSFTGASPQKTLLPIFSRPAPALHRKCSCSGGAKCAQCDEEEVESAKGIHRKSTSTSRDSAVAPDNLLQNLGSGRALEPPVRKSMESRFGQDLGGVRIHDDAGASQSAKSINAQAYTSGSHIYFSSGSYAPQSNEGQRLLAHELTHVVQQGGGSAKKSEKQNSNPAPSSGPAIASAESGKVHRQFLIGPGDLIGRGWLSLSPSIKAMVIDKAIDALLSAIDVFPGRALIGEVWIFLKEGLLGFYGKLKSTAAEVKIKVVDKIAMIMSGQDDKFALAFLKGLLKGFFIDGALGIFIAIYDLIKGLASLWDFLKGIGESIGGFPDEMREWLQRAKNFGGELVDGFGAAIDQVKAAVLNPDQAGSFISAIIEQGKSFAREGGAKIASALLDFFTKDDASAVIGGVVGDIVGMALWEALFAALTAGGGAAVTAIKEAAAGLGKLAAKIVASILKVVEEIRALVSKVVEFVKGGIKFIKGKLSELGGKLGKLIEEIGEFLGKLLSNCHESKLACKFPAKVISQIEKTILELEKVAANVPGMTELVTRIRTAKFQPFVHGLVFQAERAIEYAKAGKLLAIERTEKVGEEIARFDMVVKDLGKVSGGKGLTNIVVETKNWTGFSKLSEADQLRRLDSLGEQLTKFLKSGNPVRLEWKGAVPSSVQGLVKGFKGAVELVGEL